MPVGDPRDRFFYPTPTLMMDSYNQSHMGLDARKPVLGGLRTTKVQTCNYQDDLDDLLNIDNPYFKQMVDQIYLTGLQLN